jgi:uncharacterized protein
MANPSHSNPLDSLGQDVQADVEALPETPAVATDPAAAIEPTSNIDPAAIDPAAIDSVAIDPTAVLQTEAQLSESLDPAEAVGMEAIPSPDPQQPSWGQRLGQGFRRRGWQWVSLGITVPFLALNGLAAWQARSLTHYSKPQRDALPIFAQAPLKRWLGFALGVKVPRPHNDYSPADIGLAFDSHRIDLGNGEFLAGWYVPAPKAMPAPEAATPPQSVESSPPSPPKSQADAGAGAEAGVDAEAGAKTEPGSQPDQEAGKGVLQTIPAPAPVKAKQGIVLLFPAYAASKQTLLQEVKLLHRLGYASFAVDPRGVGDASGNGTTLGRREAADVAATVDYVKKTFGNGPIALYGRIMSAGTVMRAIAEYDLQPNAVILENPYAQLFSLTQASVESVGLPRSPITQMLTLWGGVIQGGDPATLDPITYAPEVTQPTLVLYGSEEAWVSLDEVVGIHSQLQGAKEIIGLSSERDLPLSATASGPWMNRVEQFLDANLGKSAK